MRESVPFFQIADMTASVQFYKQLGFTIVQRWDVDGHLRWCRLENGGAALMLQQRNGDLGGTPGMGISVCFMCDDALAIHDAALAGGVSPLTEPCVGNQLWVVRYRDPDGYHIALESPTDLPEETMLSMVRAS